MGTAIFIERRPATVQNTVLQDLQRRRLYILPSRHGLLFVALLFAIFIGAINYNNSMAFMLTFFLASLATVGIFYTHKNLSGLIITTMPPAAVFVDEKIQFFINIENNLSFPRYALNFSKTKKQKSKQICLAQHIEPVIAAKSICRISLSAVALRRGVFSVSRYKLTSFFPLGLLYAWSYIDIFHDCIVYPKPIGTMPLPIMTDQMSYQQQGGEQGGIDDFMGFRDYRYGDPIHHIHWKSVAKGLPMQVKKFTGYGHCQAILHWQDTENIPTVEARLSQISAWIVMAKNQGLQYGLILPNLVLPVGSGNEHYHRCLRALATF